MTLSVQQLAARALLATAVAILAACGGGASSDISFESQVAKNFATAALERSPATAPRGMLAAPRRPMAALPTLSTAAFFDWVPTKYAEHFNGAYVEGTWQTYSYRFYPSTQNYLGVSNGDVYVLGPITDGRIARIAPMTDYACGVFATNALCLDAERSALVEWLNHLRVGGGFGALQLSSRVNQAAQAHADYLVAHHFSNGVRDPYLSTLQPNGWSGAHVEYPTRLGFTGELPATRIAAAGYSTPVASSEVVGTIFGLTPGIDPDMLECMSGLINTVFHRAALLDTTMQDVGIGVSTTPVVDANGYAGRTCVVDFASTATSPPLPAGWTGIYPFDGQTAVPLKMALEDPDPAPSVAVKGSPISLQTAAGQTLAVSSFILRDDLGAIVDTVMVTGGGYLRTNEAYLVPVGALRASAIYTVQFVGTSDGAAISRIWRFTTAAL